MPSRILKESICTSETIEQLSPIEEIAFYRLLVNCDDYGRMDGRPSILKARLFPLRDIRLDQISAILNKLASAELVTLYEVDGKPFIQTAKWEKHQQIRAKKSKFPAPQNNCNQMISDDIKCPRNPIQSEYESKSEAESETRPPATARSNQPFITDDDVNAYQESMAAIEKLAKQIGIPWAQTDYFTAEKFMADYSAEWVLKAMERASKGQASCRSWRYIEGILKAWRAKGGIDDEAAPKAKVDAVIGKRVSHQQYTQRQYAEIDLVAAAANLFKQENPG